MEVIQLIQLNEKQIDLIKRSEHSWIEFGNERYYIKRHRTKLEYSEVVAYEVAKLFNLECAKYIPFRYNNKLYYLSQELKGFIPSSIFHARNASLYEYWLMFEIYYPDYSSRLLIELIKVFFLDIVLMNPDRNHNNWGIIPKKDGPHICILDNELIFSSNPTLKISSYYMDNNNKDYLKKPNYNEVDSISELDNFLKTSTDEFIDLLCELLARVIPEKFYSIVQKIEEEYQDKILDKKWYMHIYAENFQKINLVLESYTSKVTR